MENRVRSISKSVSWRFIATLTTMVLVLFFTKNVIVSFQIGAIDFFGKLAVYYFHERLWNVFQFGRK
jgi:adenylylsulfate kinase